MHISMFLTQKTIRLFSAACFVYMIEGGCRGIATKQKNDLKCYDNS
jgi:hypothetical protein